MRPLWNRLLPPGFGCDCCCGSVEAQELGLLVVDHPWGDDCLRIPGPLGFFGFAVDDYAPGGKTCLRYDCCSGPRPGAMKRRQRVLSLELFNHIFDEVYDTFHLRVLRHLHESQGCFCHRGDWSSEDWIRDIVEFVIEVVRSVAQALHSPLH